MILGKNYCLTIGVDTILNWSKKELSENVGLLQKDDGTIMNEIQMYNLAAKAKKEGFIVIPMCDNYDKRGYCQGHEVLR